MKQSRFTTCIPLQNGYTIIYNALNDKFIVSNSINLSLRGNQITGSADKLTGQLSEAGVLLDDGVDEVKLLADLFERIDNNDSEYHIHINPTLNCNFRCWYCYEEHQSASRMQDGVLQAVLKLLATTVERNCELKVLYLSFFGGEPLLYYRDIALPIIHHAQDICAKRGVELQLHFTTNGYFLSGKVLESLKGIDTSFQITVDGGREFHDKTRFCINGKGSYHRIRNNIKEAAKDNNNVIFRINYTAENLKSVYDIPVDMADIDNDAKKNISVDLQRVWQDLDSDNDIENEVSHICSLFRDKGFSCHTHYMRGAPGSSCYGDKRNNVLINYNGDVFFCTARDFKREDRAGYLDADGQIVWENNALERRMAVKFSRDECRNCRIAPICGGGCRQRAMERINREGCLLDYSEENKTDIVLRRFEQFFVKTESDGDL